ncbi:MAG: magnesium transporter [Pirellulaceae bacterium]|nr:magnesium transporter [Pirellulaceae bacterium]
MSTMPADRGLNDLVAQHMRTDIAVLHVQQTVGEALASMRENPPASRIVYFYVVDDDNRLKGVVPTRRLLLNPPDKPLGDIMVREVITIPSTATVLDACEFFIFHRLLAFPVVDEERRILGVVDVELYTEELTDLDRREGNDQLFQLIGVHLTEAQQVSPVAAFRSRFPWLLANITGGILAAFLSGVFKAELQKAVALALFIPVVLALAESVSIQSVSLALQVLRGKQPTLPEIARKLRAEFMTGLFLGVASGVAVAVVALLWLGELRVVLCLLGGIAGGVTCAAVIGVSMPNLIRFFDREPHVAAGPVALASTDMVTLLIYFTLARWLLA